MLWPLLIPALLLGGTLAASQLPTKFVVLRAGRSYRFTISCDPPRELTKPEWDSMIAALRGSGARDVEFNMGPPIVVRYTQDVLVNHTVELGRWVSFEVEKLGLFRLRFDDVQEIPSRA